MVNSHGVLAWIYTRPGEVFPTHQQEGNRQGVLAGTLKSAPVLLPPPPLCLTNENMAANLVESEVKRKRHYTRFPHVNQILKRAELYAIGLCSLCRHGNVLPARPRSFLNGSQSENRWKCRHLLFTWQHPFSFNSPTSGKSQSCCYMVPDLSPASPDVFTLGPPAALLLGNIFSVGVTAGLPTPEELELLDRCWPDGGRTGLMGGGRSWAPASRAERAGLKVVIISEVELLLRRMAASGSRIMMVCSGLPGSELTGFFMGSRVSKTTSGACLTVFCRSSSRSSCRAVDIVFSMSW